jgi:hypothetical protein
MPVKAVIPPPLDTMAPPAGRAVTAWGHAFGN